MLQLGIRLGRGDITKRFAESVRGGFYPVVKKTGELGANDETEADEITGVTAAAAHGLVGLLPETLDGILDFTTAENQFDPAIAEAE